MDNSEEVEPRFTVYSGYVIEKLPYEIGGGIFAYYKLTGKPVAFGYPAPSALEAKIKIDIEVERDRFSVWD